MSMIMVDRHHDIVFHNGIVRNRLPGCGPNEQRALPAPSIIPANVTGPDPAVASQPPCRSSTREIREHAAEMAARTKAAD